MASFNLIRGLSTTIASRAIIRPPTQCFGVDGRYATALYSAAIKSKNLEIVEKDLLKLANILATDVSLVCPNKPSTCSVLATFEQIMASHRGEVSCVVTTAKALDRATERELTSALEQFLEPGQKLHLSLKVDPELIGGMVVSIGDKYVDMSILRKVRFYKAILDQPVKLEHFAGDGDFSLRYDECLRERVSCFWSQEFWCESTSRRLGVLPRKLALRRWPEGFSGLDGLACVVDRE
ncbi:ATP synthase subunit O mitochondrial [Taenia crassiceps]|uniref:Oligomycin sensitivity conferral protein n=1 Tax=Taenia crassiceps TaxID=6207 RepID=A0ABR4Q3H8_9CEST